MPLGRCLVEFYLQLGRSVGRSMLRLHAVGAYIVDKGELVLKFGCMPRESDMYDFNRMISNVEVVLVQYQKIHLRWQCGSIVDVVPAYRDTYSVTGRMRNRVGDVEKQE
jgi:hypothetical protein